MTGGEEPRKWKKGGNKNLAPNTIKHIKKNYKIEEGTIDKVEVFDNINTIEISRTVIFSPKKAKNHELLHPKTKEKEKEEKEHEIHGTAYVHERREGRWKQYNDKNNPGAVIEHPKSSTVVWKQAHWTQGTNRENKKHKQFMEGDKDKDKFDNPTWIKDIQFREQQGVRKQYEEQQKRAQKIAKAEEQSKRDRKAAEERRRGEGGGSSASSVLEPEFSLYQQLLAKFTKQEEGQKFQNQVEVPPKENN